MKTQSILMLILFVLPLPLLEVQGQAKPKDIDPCALMSKAEASAIMGELKGEPKPDTGLLNERECHYENTQGQHVVLRVYGADRWGFKKGEVSEMKPADIAGLGDEAFSVQRGTEFEIYIRKGEVILEVDSSTSKEVARKMAEKALSGIK